MGRADSSAAGRLLTAAADRADSAAERLLVALLRQAGIDGWVLGHPVGPYRIDLAWHVDPERFRHDRRKGNFLARIGWNLLRFTWHDLDGRPTESVAVIREAVAAAA